MQGGDSEHVKLFTDESFININPTVHNYSRLSYSRQRVETTLQCSINLIKR